MPDLPVRSTYTGLKTIWIAVTVPASGDEVG